MKNKNYPKKSKSQYSENDDFAKPKKRPIKKKKEQKSWQHSYFEDEEEYDFDSSDDYYLDSNDNYDDDYDDDII